MNEHAAYSEIVAAFGRRFIAATTDRERDAAHADLLGELALLNVLGPRDRADAARDPGAERILAARFGERVH